MLGDAAEPCPLGSSVGNAIEERCLHSEHQGKEKGKSKHGQVRAGKALEKGKGFP